MFTPAGEFGNAHSVHGVRCPMKDDGDIGHRVVYEGRDSVFAASIIRFGSKKLAICTPA